MSRPRLRKYVRVLIAAASFAIAVVPAFALTGFFWDTPETEGWRHVLVLPDWSHVPIACVIFFGIPLLVARLTYHLLSLIRRDHKGFCPQCEYNLYGLTSNTCPECGTPFDPKWLEPDDKPVVPWWHEWKVELLVVILFIAACVSLFAYRVYRFVELTSTGHQMAENDWQNNEPIWYMTRKEERTLYKNLGADFHNMYFMSETPEPQSGLRLEPMGENWEDLWSEKAYRETIQEKFEAAGRQPPTFEKPEH